MPAKTRVYQHTGLKGPYSTKYHRQNTSDDCGQACAEMLLRSFEVEFRQQRELVSNLAYNCVGAPVSTELDGWGSNPGCLAQVLNDEAGNPHAQRQMKLLDCNSERAASNAIVHSLRLGGVSCAALIDDMKHWVAVYGYEIANDPTNYVNCSQTPYDITALYVHDPAPNPLGIVDGQLVEFDPPNQQHGQDDWCGRGMIDSRAKDDQGNPIYENWGLAYRRIKYDHWRQNVFTGVSRTPSQHWDKKYLAVIDVTDPFDEEVDCRSCDAVRPGSRPVSDFVCTSRNDNIPRWAEDITIFTEEDAQGIRDIVRSELRAEGLIPNDSGKYSVPGASDDWQAILEGTRPCGVYPVSPPYISGDGFYYYLVEMVKEGYECNMVGLKPMPAAILVSACEGNEHVLEMAAVTREGTTALHFAPPELFISAVADRVREMSAKAHNPSRILLAPDPDAMPTPSEIRLVWEPVMGGLSPYAPFYRFEIPGPKGSDTDPSYFFVRADYWGSRTLFIPTDPQQPLPNVKTDIFMKYKVPVPSRRERRNDT